MDEMEWLERDKRLAPYVTRWGADPTRLGPALPSGAIPPSRISGAPAGCGN